ncbi:hypothetical protein T11_11482 [Trichinella zimbabwensis]|uniref:Uncharacterized protein n=1 Tax=Trichinella zimbabwensis TaxID=268475 RepID=A0A0V1HB41_9BILA|nr:hypothetical protein T11_11482 [Trichinella zimbabwensis]
MDIQGIRYDTQIGILPTLETIYSTTAGLFPVKLSKTQ